MPSRRNRSLSAAARFRRHASSVPRASASSLRARMRCASSDLTCRRAATWQVVCREGQEGRNDSGYENWGQNYMNRQREIGKSGAYACNNTPRTRLLDGLTLTTRERCAAAAQPKMARKSASRPPVWYPRCAALPSSQCERRVAKAMRAEHSHACLAAIIHRSASAPAPVPVRIAARPSRRMKSRVPSAAKCSRYV